LAYGLFRDHAELRGGHLIIGDKPGFGLEVDWGFVDKYRSR
jgi:L-alanine-DL-glutamate epimerase-like enolase superfamily enzyme